MEVYFVRHGETNGNVAHRHQRDNTPLTFLGEDQAKAAAKMVAGFKPTHLLSSRLLRALETAKAIGEECDLVPQTSENFIELDRPQYLYGHHHTSLRSFWFYAEWYFGFGAGKTKGESYRALRERIEVAKRELSLYPEDARILVVSHAVFINFFVAHLCRTRGLGPFAAAKTFYKMLSMENGEVIKVTFNQSTNDGSCVWSVG